MNFHFTKKYKYLQNTIQNTRMNHSSYSLFIYFSHTKSTPKLFIYFEFFLLRLSFGKNKNINHFQPFQPFSIYSFIHFCFVFTPIRKIIQRFQNLFPHIFLFSFCILSQHYPQLHNKDAIIRRITNSKILTKQKTFIVDLLLNIRS